MDTIECKKESVFMTAQERINDTRKRNRQNNENKLE